jgi:thiol-disulfide isomerase/thioredoxin
MQEQSKLTAFGLSIVVVTLATLSVCVAFAAQKTTVIPVEKRPYVLVVYADWCPNCQQLKPTLALINEKYRDRIRFVRYDITSDESIAMSQEKVGKLGLSKFFENNHEQTALVVIMDSARHEIFRALNDYDPSHYESILDQQLQATTTTH